MIGRNAMRESEFENYLISDDNIISKVKAVQTRMPKLELLRNFWTYP